MRIPRITAAPAILLLAAMVLSCLLYLPNLGGDFIFDDGPGIVQNVHVQVDSLDPYAWLNAVLLQSTGPLKRPLAFASFTLNHYLTGLDPFYFKLVNWLLHLLSGALVWALSRRLLTRLLHRDSARLAAAATAAVWLLHPMQLTVVLYAVQRMTGMAALFCLLGMLCYVSGRERLAHDKAGGMTRVVLAFLLCTPLAALSKENGALLPLYLLLIELFFFRTRPVARYRHVLTGLFTLTVLAPAVLGITWAVWHWDSLNQSIYRSYEYGPLTRLLTQTRILWQYLWAIWVPDGRWYTLYHDSIVLSRGLLQPWTTLPAALGLAGLAVCSWALRRRAPVAGFGIAFFLAGHLLESTILPLELVFEHRNYLPSLGPLLILCYYLPHPGMASYLPLRRAALPLLVMLCALVTWPRADAWGRGMPYLQHYELTHSPDSPRIHRSLMGFYGYLAVQATEPELREHYYHRSLHHAAYCTEGVEDPTQCLLFRHRLASSMQRPVTPALLDEAGRHLGGTRLMIATGEEIEQLLQQCTHETPEHCPTSLEQVDLLLEALVHNPYHSKYMRVAHLAPLVDYYMRGRGLPWHSWRLLLEMRRVPSLRWAELEARVATIYWLLHAGLPALARQEWAALEMAHPVYSRSHTALAVRALLPPVPAS